MEKGKNMKNGIEVSPSKKKGGHFWTVPWEKGEKLRR